jgi:hypothetical protein
VNQTVSSVADFWHVGFAETIEGLVSQVLGSLQSINNETKSATGQNNTNDKGATSKTNVMDPGAPEIALKILSDVQNSLSIQEKSSSGSCSRSTNNTIERGKTTQQIIDELSPEDFEDEDEMQEHITQLFSGGGGSGGGGGGSSGGIDVGVDIDSGGIDVGIDAGIDIGNGGIDAGIDVGIDIGSGGISGGIDIGIGIGGIDIGIDIGIGIGDGNNGEGGDGGGDGGSGVAAGIATVLSFLTQDKYGLVINLFNKASNLTQDLPFGDSCKSEMFRLFNTEGGLSGALSSNALVSPAGSPLAGSKFLSVSFLPINP